MKIYKHAQGDFGVDFELLRLVDCQNGYGLNWYNNEIYFNVIITFDAIKIRMENECFQVGCKKMVFIGPRKKITIESDKPASGYLIRFTSHFYEKSSMDSILINSDLFFDDTQILKIVNTRRNESEFKQQVVDRIGEYLYKSDQEINMFTHNLVESLLLEGIWGTNADDLSYFTDKDFSAQALVNRFSILVHKHYKRKTDVKFYADKLNISSRKLTYVCLSLLNRTAKRVITDIILKEALLYIKHTHLSISQISYEMGFSEESNFRHFIKKHSGKTPLEYRKVDLLPKRSICENFAFC